MVRISLFGKLLDLVSLAWPGICVRKKWSVAAAVGSTLGLAIVTSILKSRANKPQKPTKDADGYPLLILNTMPISHFAERVRWCMQRMQIPFEEEVDVGVVMRVVTGRTIPTLHIPSIRTTIGNSQDMLRYFFGQCNLKPKSVSNEQWRQFFDPYRKAMFPPMKSSSESGTPKSSDGDESGWVTRDGFEIERMFEKTAQSIQRLSYGSEFAATRSDRIRRMWGVHLSEYIPWYQRLLGWVLYPVLMPLLRKGFQCTPDRMERSRQDIIQTVQFVSKTLSGDPERGIPGRKYIMDTDEPTFIDVSFASFIGVMFMDEGYYAGGMFRDVPGKRTDLEDSDDDLSQFVKDHVLGTEAERFINEMYHTHRFIPIN